MPQPRSAAASNTSTSFPEDPKALLGRKVTLRYRLRDDEHPYSEVVGVVQAVITGPADEELEIVTRRGKVVTIAMGDVIAGKVFP